MTAALVVYDRDGELIEMPALVGVDVDVVTRDGRRFRFQGLDGETGARVYREVA